MRRDRDTIVSLTGGLGNQLFQLAIGLNAAQGGKVILEWCAGKPRLNKFGVPEIATFKLPVNVSLDSKRKNNLLVTKSAGYMLRMGFEPKSFEKPKSYFMVLSFLVSIVLSFHFKRLLRIYPARKHGFYEINSGAKGNFLVGYFQSYKWADQEEVLETLHSLRIIGSNPKLAEMRNLALIENPLVVHIRLGDYKNEDAFGILPRAYYEKSINRMWESGEYKKIWAFSDEPEIAKDFLSFVPAEDLRWIGEIDNSASLTLEVMRYGRGYIIGNSTYSWWGAFLSVTPDAMVIAPEPWFQKLSTPQELVPPHWARESSW